MKFWGKFCLILVIFGICLAGGSYIYAMSSTNYYINWDSINIGGTDYSSSTNFYMLDTLGQLSSGKSTSTNFTMLAGYRQGITDPSILHFLIYSQNDASKTSYSAFDNTNKQVTVASAASYAIGNYISVIENKGASQMVAIGKITNIAGNVINVDKWDGDNAAMSAVPAGGDDWAYKQNTHEASLGMLTTSIVGTAVSMAEVTTNAENGYTVSARENHDLQYGPFTIGDVTDGTVTAGSEEYGMETTGTYASGTNDFLINSTGQSVQVRDRAGTDDRIAIIYKAAISSSTEGGGYSHTVSYYLTANF